MSKQKLFLEYQDFVVSTTKKEVTTTSRSKLAVLGFGLSTEISEFSSKVFDLSYSNFQSLDENMKNMIISELGDIMWYIAFGCQILETTSKENYEIIKDRIQFENIKNDYLKMQGLIHASLNFQKQYEIIGVILQKHYLNTNYKIEEKERLDIVHAFHVMVEIINKIAMDLGTSIECVIELNKEKLK